MLDYRLVVHGEIVARAATEKRALAAAKRIAKEMDAAVIIEGMRQLHYVEAD